MALLERFGLWHFISVSAWSPSIVFTLATAVVFALGLRKIRMPWPTLSLALCSLTMASAAGYLLLPVFFDDSEACVASVTALLTRGAPLYPAPDAAQLYIMGYGPLAYLPRIPLWLMFGKSVFGFKLTGVLAYFLSMIGMYRICRHFAPARASLTGLGCCCVVFFRYMPMEFWGRSDPLMLCMMTVCVWAILEAPEWVILPVAAVTVAVMPNLKLTAAVFLLPVIALVYIRSGLKTAAGAVTLGALLFWLPYFSSQISIPNYWLSLNMQRRHVLLMETLLRNLQYAGMLLAPVLAIAAHRVKNKIPLSNGQATYLALIAFALVVSSIVGSKSGAGSYHLLPAMAPILHLYFWLRSDLPPSLADRPFSRFAIAWVVSTLLFSTVQLREFLIEFRQSGFEREAVAEIRAVEARSAGQRVEVGIGNDFTAITGNFATPTFDGQPFTISGASVRDMQFAGFDIPDSTIQYIKTCGTQIWLIPAGTAPFSAPNLYFGPDHPTFQPRFRDAFLDRYRKAAPGRIFDVWTCVR